MQAGALTLEEAVEAAKRREMTVAVERTIVSNRRRPQAMYKRDLGEVNALEPKAEDVGKTLAGLAKQVSELATMMQQSAAATKEQTEQLVVAAKQQADSQLAEITKAVQAMADVNRQQAEIRGPFLGDRERRRPLVCYRCGREGHIQRNCRATRPLQHRAASGGSGSASGTRPSNPN